MELSDRMLEDGVVLFVTFITKSVYVQVHYEYLSD